MLDRTDITDSRCPFHNGVRICCQFADVFQTNSLIDVIFFYSLSVISCRPPLVFPVNMFVDNLKRKLFCFIIKDLSVYFECINQMDKPTYLDLFFKAFVDNNRRSDHRVRQQVRTSIIF